MGKETGKMKMSSFYSVYGSHGHIRTAQGTFHAFDIQDQIHKDS
jgi:hypothetical protein